MIQSNEGVSSDLRHLERTTDGSEGGSGHRRNHISGIIHEKIQGFRAPAIGALSRVWYQCYRKMALFITTKPDYLLYWNASNCHRDIDPQ